LDLLPSLPLLSLPPTVMAVVEELELVARVDAALDIFAKESEGRRHEAPFIRVDDVRPLLHSCGVYLPDWLVSQELIPQLAETDHQDMLIVRVDRMRERVLSLLEERTWEADTERDLLAAFRRVDVLSHNGKEFGYIERDKLSKLLASKGGAPFATEEVGSLFEFCEPENGQGFYYHDYLGKLIPILEEHSFNKLEKICKRSR